MCPQTLNDKVRDSTLIFGMSTLAISTLQIGTITCSDCRAKKVKIHRRINSVDAEEEGGDAI